MELREAEEDKTVFRRSKVTAGKVGDLHSHGRKVIRQRRLEVSDFAFGERFHIVLRTVGSGLPRGRLCTSGNGLVCPSPHPRFRGRRVAADELDRTSNGRSEQRNVSVPLARSEDHRLALPMPHCSMALADFEFSSALALR